MSATEGILDYRAEELAALVRLTEYPAGERAWLLTQPLSEDCPACVDWIDDSGEEAPIPQEVWRAVVRVVESIPVEVGDHLEGLLLSPKRRGYEVFVESDKATAEEKRRALDAMLVGASRLYEELTRRAHVAAVLLHELGEVGA